MAKIQKIHFVGIKGVGMTPLAIIAKEAGFLVSGSDIAEEFITDFALQKAGILPFAGFDASHTEGADLVITTGAHGGFDNVETKTAKQKNIPVLTQGEAVGVFMKGEIFGKEQFGISVAGCHGKTTTTAMMATILLKNNFDPSFVIGTSEIPSLPGPGHFGKGKYFLAEADEYATEPVYDKKPKFLWQYPKLSIFTNIEFDHPDMFKNLDEVRKAFLHLANNMGKGGILVVCGDDPEVQKLLPVYEGEKITYGLLPANDFRVHDIRINGTHMFFWVEQRGFDLGEFSLPLVGDHNAVNATGCIAACLRLGLSHNQIKRGLMSFTGTKRRFEFIGKLISGALVYDDYAHHPTEIEKTLKAFRKTFPEKKIICIFQPHTYSRTKSLFAEFAKAFHDADTAILTDIYPSLREELDPSITSEKLAMSIKNVHNNVVYLPKLPDVVEYLNKIELNNDSVIITMGAGDVYKIIESLHLRVEK